VAYGNPIQVTTEGPAVFEKLTSPKRSRPSSLQHTSAALEGSVNISADPQRGTLRWRLMVDGRWPTAEEVLVDDRVGSRNAVGFVWDDIVDGAVRAGLSRRPATPLSPGTIALHYEQSGAASSTDIGVLDERTLQELHALGYVK